MKETILIADDEVNMRILIHDFLISNNYEVFTASNGREAIDVLDQNPQVSLVILDVMMPVMNGWKACEIIKEKSDVPIIMLTAKSDEKDELFSFKRGADEYIKKPFSLVILLARIQSILKRSINRKRDYKRGCLVVEHEKHKVFVEGKEIILSKFEFEILYLLMASEGRIVSREKIIESVFGFDYEGTARAVDTQITRLRKKIGVAKKYIKTVRGYGYKFEVNE
ncbi:MAG: response regulator transcription factor [Bacilli bacterium]